MRKERSYVEKKVELRNKKVTKPLEFCTNRANGRSIKALRASYAVIELVAKVGKPHNIEELLVKAAMSACTTELLGKKATYALQKIFLSNDTLRRRQDKMAKNLEKQLVDTLKV